MQQYLQNWTQQAKIAHGPNNESDEEYWKKKKKREYAYRCQVCTKTDNTIFGKLLKNVRQLCKWEFKKDQTKKMKKSIHGGTLKKQRESRCAPKGNAVLSMNWVLRVLREDGHLYMLVPTGACLVKAKTGKQEALQWRGFDSLAESSC